MPPGQAQLTLRADYIGGWHANYRKDAAQLNISVAVGQTQRRTRVYSVGDKPGSGRDGGAEKSSNRFCSKCLCFIFKCVNDYCRLFQRENHDKPVPEGLYLRATIKPPYRFIHGQDYELLDGRFIR